MKEHLKEIDSKFMNVIKKDDISDEELQRLIEFKSALLSDVCPWAQNVVARRFLRSKGK